MKINNRFLSRLFAGFVIATVITTSVPVSAYAEELAPASEVVAVQESEDTEAAAENTFENSEVSEAEVSEAEVTTDAEKTEAADEIVTEEVEETVEIPETVTKEEEIVSPTTTETSEPEYEDEINVSYEEIMEAAKDSLPATTVLVQQTPYGPAKVQWRSSATNPYIPNTSAGTIRFVTQNPSSPLYSSSYWTGYSSTNECGTTCQSMALSYLGVQHQPYELLAMGGGLSRIGTSFWSNIQGGYDHQGYPGCNGTALKTAINNYLANVQTNPKYSPVFIHLNSYPSYSGSHYVLIIGVIDEKNGIYQALDPWDNNVSRITLTFGTYPTATYTAFSTPISDSIDEFYQFTKTGGSAGTTQPVVPDPTPTPTPGTGETIVACTSQNAVVLANEVRIRKGPDTSYAIITTVNKHKTVTVTGKSTNWYKIKFTLNGVTKTGYISREYVGIGKRPSTVSFSLKKYYGNRIKVSWKKQAGVTGYKIKRYNSTTKKYVTIKTLVGDSKVSYMDTGLKNGKTYYYRVYAYKTWNHTKSYTLTSPKPTTLSKKASSYMLAKTTGSQLNVRKGPGTNYGILKTLSNPGVEVRVYAKVNSWYKVKLKVSGVWKTGYIIKDFVKL